MRNTVNCALLIFVFALNSSASHAELTTSPKVTIVFAYTQNGLLSIYVINLDGRINIRASTG